MRTLTDILDRFKSRSAEELKAYLEGYNQAFIDMQNEKNERQKETLERLRKHQSFPRISSDPSQETNAAADKRLPTRIQNISSNEPKLKGENIDG